MEIEFLTKPDCTPSEQMLVSMLEVLGADGFEVVDLTKLSATDGRRGFDTPTLLVQGRDVFGALPRADLSVPPS